MARYTENQIQIIQEIYGMSRNLYLDDSLKSISSDYYQFDKTETFMYYLNFRSYPRFVIIFAIIIITALTFLLTLINSNTTYSIIPLGAFTFSKLLPAYRIYANWAGIKGNDEFVRNIVNTIINKKKPTNYKIAKRNAEIKKITFNNLSFEFESSKINKKIIDNFSYELNSGSRVAIIGKTGIGKSTFLDIVSCLRYPKRVNII